MPSSRQLLLYVVGPHGIVPERGSSFLSSLFGRVLEKDTMRRQCAVGLSLRG
jgi:hypothetical protein